MEDIATNRNRSDQTFRGITEINTESCDTNNVRPVDDNHVNDGRVFSQRKTHIAAILVTLVCYFQHNSQLQMQSYTQIMHLLNKNIYIALSA